MERVENIDSIIASFIIAIKTFCFSNEEFEINLKLRMIRAMLVINSSNLISLESFD
jgi:hypothetical protein